LRVKTKELHLQPLKKRGVLKIKRGKKKSKIILANKNKRITFAALLKREAFFRIRL